VHRIREVPASEHDRRLAHHAQHDQVPHQFKHRIKPKKNERKRSSFRHYLVNTKYSPVKKFHYCSVIHILEPGTDFLQGLLLDRPLLFFDLLEGADSDFSFRLSYPSFLNRQGETRTILPTRQDWFQVSGTKAVPLLGSGNRGCVILSVFYINVSAALLNEVYNSI
jgi:hypothetical protein